MPKPYRRLLFFGFLGCFVVLAPLLILYTSGYRYNWERGRIQETGVLKMEYSPKNAHVLLNDEERSTASPTHLAGLVPGKYTIELTAPERQPWKKRLWIEPSRTAFAQHMILWNAEPKHTLLEEGEFTQFVAHNSGVVALARTTKTGDEVAILSSTHELQILDFGDAATHVSIQEMYWSPNARRLLIERTATIDGTITTEQWIWSAASTQKLTPLSPLTNDVLLTEVTWGARDDDLLYGFQKNVLPLRGYQLIELDLFRGDYRPSSYMTTTPSTNYAVEDDLLYRIETRTTDDEEETVFIITPFSETARALERRIILPSITSQVRFLPSPDALLTLLDEDNRVLYIIDKETKALYPIQETIEGVTDALWSPHGNRILWTTGKELWLLDLEQARRDVVVKEEQKILDLLWHPENEYIFYSTGETIKVTEVDERDERNLYTLSTLPPHTYLAVTNKANSLVMIGELEDMQGLVKIDIANE